jgi:hypothetical protein
MPAKKNIINGFVKLILVTCLMMLNIYAFAGVTITPEGVTCFGACDGKVTISISGPNGPYEVSIIGPSSQTKTTGGSVTFTDLCFGYYSVAIQAEQCNYSGSFNIVVDPDKLQLDFDIQNEVCEKENGSITAIAKGPNPISTYEWNTGETGATLSDKPAGSYYVTVTDNKGCRKSGGDRIGRDNIDLVLDMDSEDVTCYGDDDGKASVKATDPTGLAGGGFEYKWSNGGSGSSISGLSGGIYTVTVSTDEGCANSNSVSVGEPSELRMGISGGSFNISFCSDGNPPSITLTGGASGGTPPYNYSPDPPQMEVSSSGTYSMSVVDDHGCSDNASTFVLFVPIFCSRDPNDITGPEGSGEERFVGKEETLPYTIRFENDPEFATASAQVVYITHPLDKNFDIYSMRLTEFGFGSFSFPVEEDKPFYHTRVDVSDSLGVIVDLVAGVDIAKREIFWRFSSLDPETLLPPTDPQIGFLQINDSLTHAGEGYVNFVMKPASNVHTGDILPAEAIIQFDDNDTLHTNTWTNTIDASLPSSSVDSLPPVVYGDSVVLSVSYMDDGAEFDNVDIYVSENAGYFTRLTHLEDTLNYLFYGVSGNQYSFYSQSKDKAGNYEPVKTSAEARTLFAGDEIVLIPTITHATCFGETDGAIEIMVAGGTPPFTFNWSNTDTDKDIYNLVAGDYILKVTDFYGTDVVDTFTVTEPAEIVLELGDPVYTDAPSVTLDAGTHEGYLWGDFSTNSTLTVTESGTYRVTVYDGECSTSDSIEVYFNSDLKMQDIDFLNGWNMFSLNVNVSGHDLHTLFQPLIDAGYLVKVIDETGAAFEILPGQSEFSNNIGDWAATEGYSIRVNADTALHYKGLPVDLPITIALHEGWNIMAYPDTNQQDALTFFAGLVAEEKLIKVLDESGNAMEFVPGFGWNNNIGNLTSGEGYKVKVSSDTNVAVGESLASISVPLRSSTNAELTHFKLPWIGNGYNHMNFYVLQNSNDYFRFKAGDEIAVYDGELCVGAAKVNGDEKLITIAASADDPTTSNKDGFSVDEEAVFKVWNGDSVTTLAQLDYLSDNKGVFEQHGMVSVAIPKEVVATGAISFEGGIISVYPNPFNEELVIDITLQEDVYLRVEISNVVGQIQDIIEGFYTAGHHKLYLDKLSSGKSIPEGVYNLRFISNNEKIGQTIQVIKTK